MCQIIPQTQRIKFHPSGQIPDVRFEKFVNHGQQDNTEADCDKHFQGYARYRDAKSRARRRRMFRIDNDHGKDGGPDRQRIQDQGKD